MSPRRGLTPRLTDRRSQRDSDLTYSFYGLLQDEVEWSRFGRPTSIEQMRSNTGCAPEQVWP
jgi:hypothetical protein